MWGLGLLGFRDLDQDLGLQGLGLWDLKVFRPPESTTKNPCHSLCHSREESSYTIWDLGSYRVSPGDQMIWLPGSRSCREVHSRTRYLRQFQGCLGNAQDPEAANSTRGSGISRNVVNVCKCRTIKIHPRSHIRRNTCSNCCRVVCINTRKLRTLQKMLRIPLQLPIDRPSRSISRTTGRLIVGILKL